MLFNGMFFQGENQEENNNIKVAETGKATKEELCFPDSQDSGIVSKAPSESGSDESPDSQDSEVNTKDTDESPNHRDPETQDSAGLSKDGLDSQDSGLAEEDSDDHSGITTTTMKPQSNSVGAEDRNRSTVQKSECATPESDDPKLNSANTDSKNDISEVAKDAIEEKKGADEDSGDKSENAEKPEVIEEDAEVSCNPTKDNLAFDEEATENVE